MSVRPRPAARGKNSDALAFDPNLLRSEIDLMRSNVLADSTEVTVALPEGGDSVSTTGVITQAMRDYDSLSPTEQQAASLGIHPESFRPLKELNEQHFKALQMSNSLSPQLEAKIKAFQTVASSNT